MRPSRRNTYFTCRQFAELINKRCREKFTVNADLVEEILAELLVDITNRDYKDCDTCKFYDCQADDRVKCINCENNKTACCGCALHIHSLLQCPNWTKKENENDKT